MELATTADASCGPGDLWETRDAKWNPNVTTAAVVGDGAWTIELAIPFADLNGGKTPRDGEMWPRGDTSLDRPGAEHVAALPLGCVRFERNQSDHMAVGISGHRVRTYHPHGW